MTDIENHEKRISILEDKYTLTEKNAINVTALTAKVSILLSIMTFSVIIVSAGTVYTFTGLNTFKDIYASDRLTLHTYISETQKEHADNINQTLSDLENNMDEEFKTIEEKLDKMEHVVNDLKNEVNETLYN